jgi:hypothetical protein
MNELPEPMTESDNAQQLSNNATKSLNLHRPDKELGDLDWRFSEDTGRFAMDEEVHGLNSRLVIEDPKNGAKHVLFGGTLELYLADGLRDLDHSFENTTDLPDPEPIPSGPQTIHKAEMTSPTVSLWCELVARHMRITSVRQRYWCH